MYNLIKLEIKKNNLRGYIKACIFSFIVILGFTYFISAVAKVEQEEAFQNYENIFLFSSFITMLYFCVLTTVMFSRIIIETYTGKKLMLLFSYPVSRTKVLLSKICLVVLLNVVSMSISYILALAVFSIAESFSPIVPAQLTFKIVTLAGLRIIPLALTVVGLSIIAMGLGFIKRSVQTTIVSSFILVGISGNMASGFSNQWISYLVQILILLVSIVVLKRITSEVNHMDVE